MLGESLRRRQPARRERRPRPSGRRYSRAFWLLGVPAALLLPFAIGYVLTVFVFFPPQRVAAVGIPVPSLYGLTVVQAEQALARAGLGSLEFSQLPSPTAPEGEVLAQSPLPGQQLRSGVDVRVAISSGPVQVRVPDVLGQLGDRAEERLGRFGFSVARVDSESAVDSGRVFAVDPQVGTDTRLPALVTIHVSLGLPGDSLAVDTTDATAPDTLATR